MIIAKLYNILEHLMANGVPMHTEIKIGFYSEENGESNLNAMDINGLIADAKSGTVYLACGDREVPYLIHNVEEKPHEWETFVLKVDGSKANPKKEKLAISLDVNEITYEEVKDEL